MSLSAGEYNGERRPVVFGFVLLFGLIASHSLLETARDAIFLTRISATRLPWVYLMTAGALFLVTRYGSRLRSMSFDLRKSLSTTLTVCAGITAAFWLGLKQASSPFVRDLYTWALYVWSGLMVTLLVVQFWSLLAEHVTVTQAKRQFGIIAAGGVLGATAGSFFAERLLQFLEAQSLLIVAAGILLILACIPLCFARVENSTPEAEETPLSLSFLGRNQYLRRLAIIAVLASLTLTFADYLAKSCIVAHIPAEDLPTFFARFYLVLNAIALVVQVLLASWFLRSVGATGVLVILPVLLTVGAVASLLSGALLAALLVKGADGTLRHSLHRTGMEVLYIPLPDRIRRRFKGIIDGLGQRGGQALASVLILGCVAIGVPLGVIAGSVAVLAVTWLVAILGTRRLYLDLFRGNLRAGRVETKLDLAELDLHSLESLIAALSNEDDEEVLGALDLLEHYGKTHLIPALVLYHPSPRIVVRVFDLFLESGRRDFVSIARRLRSAKEPRVRAAALRSLFLASPEDKVLDEKLSESDSFVYATWLVGRVITGRASLEEMEDNLRHCAIGGRREARLAMSVALRYQRNAKFHSTLSILLEDTEAEIRSHAAFAVARNPNTSFIPTLLPLLSHGETREAARIALVEIGKPALKALDEAMRSNDIPRRVRRHIPRTIHRFPPEDCVPILFRYLKTERDDMVVSKVLRALGRLKMNYGVEIFDRKTVEQAIEESLYKLIEQFDCVLQRKPHSAKMRVLQRSLVACLSMCFVNANRKCSKEYLGSSISWFEATTSSPCG